MIDAEMPAVSRSFCSLAALGEKFSKLSALGYSYKVTTDGTFQNLFLVLKAPQLLHASITTLLSTALVNCACLCAHRIVCVHVACLHADAGCFLLAARTVVFATPCGLAQHIKHTKASNKQAERLLVCPRSAVTSPTSEESNRSLVHTVNAHHLAPDAAALGAAVATSLPAVFFSMP